MSKQKQAKQWTSGYVYSTDPDFPFTTDNGTQETLAPGLQKLRIWLETKNRGGKPTTVIKGFSGKEDDLKELGKQLKNFCGTGGSVKDQEAIIQGDQRDKVLAWLLKAGYSQSKKAGN